MKLTFLGASGTVTGSKYHLEGSGQNFLIDCGLFQGLKELRLRNWEDPEFDPSKIDAVFLTHGHLDHSGYLPRLVKLGFRGKIYATLPTMQVAEIILKDSAKVNEEEARRANKEGYSKHKPALPLYTLKEVEKTMKLFQPVEEGKWFTFQKACNVRFQYAGHILGACFIEIEMEGKRLVFSGDVGRPHDLLLHPPKKPERAHLLLIESTYGGKNHPDEETMLKELETVIVQTLARGGSVFIPSFAVERAQLLMLILSRFLKEKRIPKVPMIMDSPMGSNMLELFHSSEKWHRLSYKECVEMCKPFWITQSFEETMKLKVDPRPKIVIAGSGMMTGGRILNYFEEHGGNEKDTLLFVGYQAEGTRGRRLLDGEKEIKVYGKNVVCRMQIEKIDGLSAHADQAGLLDWLSEMAREPRKLFLVHGEKEQAEALKEALFKERGWEAEPAAFLESVEL